MAHGRRLKRFAVHKDDAAYLPVFAYLLEHLFPRDAVDDARIRLCLFAAFIYKIQIYAYAYAVCN